MTPDVNVLVAASRSDHVHYKSAQKWLRSALAAGSTGATFRLIPLAVASFLRLVTNPKIFVDPTPIDDAIAFVDSLLAVSHVEMAAVGHEWPLLRQLCLDHKLRANDLPDAWLAATVMQLGEHLVTFDGDFKKLLRRDRLTVLTA